MRNVIALVLIVVPLTYGCATQKRAVIAHEKVIRLEATVFFDFDSHKLRKDMIPLLKGIADKVRGNPNIVVMLEGHTDRIGPASYNDVLAEERARAVGAYLAQQGVGHRRMTFVSKGEREPVDPGRTRKAHRKNRRVEVHQI